MISVIVPTYNEIDALPILVSRLTAAMRQAGHEFEIIVVDDNSPDGTGQHAEELAATYPVKVLRRPGKLGLASAVLDGLSLATGRLIAVMDADLSHPPEVIPKMVHAMHETGADLAVGSRYVPGGRIEDWPIHRTLVSAVANLLTKWLTPVNDATSGFFIITRSALLDAKLNPIGFKIGLEVMTRAKYHSYVEVPYIFTDRMHGSSKFGSREIRAFLHQLLILYFDRSKPPRRPRMTYSASKSGG